MQKVRANLGSRAYANSALWFVPRTEQAKAKFGPTSGPMTVLTRAPPLLSQLPRHWTAAHVTRNICSDYALTVSLVTWAKI